VVAKLFAGSPGSTERVLAAVRPRLGSPRSETARQATRASWPHGLPNSDGVTRAFNWKGELTGYRVENSFIPLDERNVDARALAERIAAGECVVLDPQIKLAFPVHDKKGTLTGYDTDAGFIPADPNNALFKILRRAIENRSCELGQENLIDAPPKITALIFCIHFARPWPHLVGPLWRNWEYRPTENSHLREFRITILNLPAEPDDLLQHIATSLESSEPTGLYQLIPLRNGLLEIEIPVASLGALFRGERTVGFGWISDHLEDSLQRELVRSGRSTRDGPGIEWLLVHAREYLSRAIVDITNGVISAFCREYGGNIVGYLTEEAFHRSTFVFATRENASNTFYSLNVQPAHSFQLQGEWRVRPLTPASIELNRQLNTDGALLRIRGLIEAGFPHEALSVANAYLEIIAMPVALAAINGDQEAARAVIASGYRDRLEIIESTAVAEPKGYIADALLKFIQVAKSIYPHRNDYMHDLRSVEHEYWRTVDVDRQARILLAPLLDVFEMRVWFGWLFNLIGRLAVLSPSATAAAQRKAKYLSKKASGKAHRPS